MVNSGKNVDRRSTEYQIRTDLNCDPVNVVYLIKCNLCK